MLPAIVSIGVLIWTSVIASAQQRPGEIIQELERDRRQQELERKQKEPKEPPVIIERNDKPHDKSPVFPPKTDNCNETGNKIRRKNP